MGIHAVQIQQLHSSARAHCPAMINSVGISQAQHLRRPTHTVGRGIGTQSCLRNRRKRSKNRNSGRGWAAEHHLGQPETLLFKSQCHPQALAECPVLARLWEDSMTASAHEDAVRGHLLGASRCLWVLEASSWEGPDGLVGHFCRSISWVEVKGRGGEQRGDNARRRQGAMWRTGGRSGRMRFPVS